MTLVEAVPLIAVAALIGTCVWVYRDARANVDAGTPIVLEIGGFRIETAQAWAAGVLVLVVLFLPLYLAARNTTFAGRR